jgi:hypothetical protein
MYVTVGATTAQSANLEKLTPKEVLVKTPEPVPSKSIIEAEVVIIVITAQQMWP